MYPLFLEYSTENTTGTVAGKKVSTQYFTAATELSDGSAKDCFDGTLGLGFPILSSDPDRNHLPLVQTALKERVVTTSSFGLRLASTGAQLSLGGADRRLYRGRFEKHAVDNSKGYWSLTGASLFAGSTMIASNFYTMLDSGTDRIFGPIDAVCAFKLLMAIFF